MIKFIKSICGIFLSFVMVSAAIADEQPFKEGEHYRVVEANQLSEIQEITEFMSFYCGHCFMFRSVLNQIRAAFPQVKININPVAFLGGEMGPMSQRAFAAAKIMGVEEKFSDELFNQIHQMHKTDYNPEALGDIIAYIGADKQQFLETFDSFVAISQVAAYNAEMDKAVVKGVPTLMINHKYIILKAEKDEVELLIKYLLEKDNIPLTNN